MTADRHLAELNIARLRAPLDAPETAPFAEALDRVNGLGDRSDGFIWRLQDETGDATSVQMFDDPMIIVNLTVWRDVAALKAFAYKGEHASFFRRRREWFETGDQPGVVLWWIPAGHRPSVDEARERLEHLRINGPSSHAFTFATVALSASDPA